LFATYGEALHYVAGFARTTPYLIQTVPLDTVETVAESVIRARNAFDEPTEPDNDVSQYREYMRSLYKQ
jgi:hypothetical protein